MHDALKSQLPRPDLSDAIRERDGRIAWLESEVARLDAVIAGMKKERQP